MVVCGDSMELNRDYESAAIYKWRKKRKKAFILFICIVGICFLVTRMVRVEDKTTVKVHNMHTEQIQRLQLPLMTDQVRHGLRSFWMD